MLVDFSGAGGILAKFSTGIQEFNKNFARNLWLILSSLLEHFHSHIERIKNLNKVNFASITAYIELHKYNRSISTLFRLG